MSTEPKAHPDFVDTAHRVVMEATGQWPNTKPPTQEPDDEGEERRDRRPDQSGGRCPRRAAFRLSPSLAHTL